MAEGYIPTGIPKLDELLGGGYTPGSLVVIKGATGIGKTRLLVQSALSQVPHSGIFYDTTIVGSPQPILEFSERFFGRQLRVWTPDQSKMTHWTNPGDVKEQLSDFLVRCDLRAEERRSIGIMAQHHTDHFLAAHLHYGSGIIVIDGILPPNSIPGVYALQVNEASDLIERVRSHKLDRPPKYEYDGEKSVFIVGETSGFVQMGDLFRFFNADSPFCSQAETVLLYAYTGDTEKPTRVLRVAKHRHKTINPKDFKVVERDNMLDLEEL